MDGIFFWILAFLTAFSSVKLSYYGDILGKESKLGSALIGGILIASITSLPEFITSISAVLINNPSLSFGDILGSNMFNIFIIAIFNLYFFRKNIFNSLKKSYKIECLILIIEYLLIIYSFMVNNKSIITILLFISYIIYTISIVKNKNEERITILKESNPLIKFIILSIALIILSSLLTIEADRITRLYPKISSSSVGAILLGITTSLPEVVSTFTLIKLNNIDMAISNILGSNIFNFLVLAFSDLFLKKNHIFTYIDNYSNMYLFGGLIIMILLVLAIYNRKRIFSFILTMSMIFIYLIVWYFQFR